MVRVSERLRVVEPFSARFSCERCGPTNHVMLLDDIVACVRCNETESRRVLAERVRGFC